MIKEDEGMYEYEKERKKGRRDRENRRSRNGDREE